VRIKRYPPDQKDFTAERKGKLKERREGRALHTRNVEVYAMVPSLCWGTMSRKKQRKGSQNEKGG